ncbi:hypothetical protein ACQ5SK_29735 [Bradyrhizobium japonicum]
MQLSLGRLAEFGYLKFEVKEGGTYVNAYRLLLEEAMWVRLLLTRRRTMVSLWMTRRRTSVRFLPVQSPKGERA